MHDSPHSHVTYLPYESGPGAAPHAPCGTLLVVGTNTLLIGAHCPTLCPIHVHVLRSSTARRPS